MENLTFYNLCREVPDSAKKPITAGRIKGMTDINPMWRIKKLTEMFGPCGLGWWYEIKDQRIVFDEITNQKAAFVDILLFYVDPESGHESRGIPGTGGSSFVSQETSKAYMSDECFKMALTDSISVAAKAIGVGADVYFDKDRTKYSGEEAEIKMETSEDARAFVITFGKHKGKTIGELFDTDWSYLEWLLNSEKTDPVIKQAVDILRKEADGKMQMDVTKNRGEARKKLVRKLKELGIDVNAYAQANNLQNNTDPAVFERLLKELEEMK